MVIPRRIRIDSVGSEDSERSINPRIIEHFAEFDNLSFPQMEYDLPPEKTLKERILEQHRERVKAIKEHERRFKGDSFVSVDIFLRRNDRELALHGPNTVTNSNIFSEDIKSYDDVSDLEPYVNPTQEGRSNFDDLHEPRQKVVLSQKHQTDFLINSKKLDKDLNIRKIPRLPNATKRFQNLAKVNLRVDRVYQQEAEQKFLDPEIEDVFGHIQLLPNTFTKQMKDDKYKDPMIRKQEVIERYVDLIHDFDYSNRPGNKEDGEYAALLKRKEELESFLDDPKLDKIPSSSAFISTKRQEVEHFEMREYVDNSDSSLIIIDDPMTGSSPVPTSGDNKKHSDQPKVINISSSDTVFDEPQRMSSTVKAQKSVGKQSHIRETGSNSVTFTHPTAGTSAPTVILKEKETLKRKIVDFASETVAPKKIGKEQRMTSESVKEQRNSVEKTKMNDKIAEDLRRKKRQDFLDRENASMEKQRRNVELLQQSQIAKEEEFTKLRQEQMRQEKVEMEERKRQQEEKRIAQEAADKKRRAEEEEKRKREEQQIEFEKLKRAIEVQKNADNKPPVVSAALVRAQRPPVTLYNGWVVKKCKIPGERLERKEKFFTKFGWPTDEVERQLDQSAAWAKATALGLENQPNGIIIPQENNAKTIVHSLTRPLTKRAPVAARIVPPAPARPELIPATIEDIEKVVREVKALMAPTRKQLAIRCDLYSGEIDYQSFSIVPLKMNIKYPFRQSDGMYWPVFYALKDNSASTHVKALTKCHSFSGKYASFNLLTSTQEDEARKCQKKFDGSYADSGGDWAEYSQKAGRFSKRIGFKAHRSKCNETYDQQRLHAREYQKSKFKAEVEKYDNYQNDLKEYELRRDRRKYNQSLKIHLRELVRDARLDAYSLRETFEDVEGRAMDHPGTRENVLEPRWSGHGYRIYLETRDREYGHFMEKVCYKYERLLPSRYSYEKFNEWCFAPMLASLYHQMKHKPFDCFRPNEMARQKQRRAAYDGILKERKFNLKQALDLCRLTESDKRQWTILHDQLVAQFRDFPAIFQMMFDTKCDLIKKVDRTAHNLMQTRYRECQNYFCLQQSHQEVPQQQQQNQFRHPR